MSEPTATLGELTRPATVLIEKISDAIGGLAKPWQIERLARAEAKAALIKANTDIEIDGVKRRALARLLNEEGKRQENIEHVIAGALQHLNSDADPSGMNNDWVEHLFEKSRHISDNEMQVHWSKLLAGEANRPGSFSKNTINILSNMSTNEAKLFRKLSSSFIEVQNNVPQERESQPWCVAPYIPDININPVGDIMLEHEDFVALEALSLIRISQSKTYCYRYEKNIRSTIARYRELEFHPKLNLNHELVIGPIILTKWGVELSRLFEWSTSEEYRSNVGLYLNSGTIMGKIRLAFRLGIPGTLIARRSNT